MNRVLVIAAHPDDEVLGCGGAIARHAADGDEVHVLILAEGATSRDPGGDWSTELNALRRAAQEAGQVLGARSVEFGTFPDNSMDTVPLLDVTKAVEAAVAQHRPAVIYTHHVGDVNIDHQVIHRAVVTACRPQPGHPVKTLLFFEVASSTEWQPPGSGAPFLPNWFVDIGDTLDAKLKALDVYALEMRVWPHPRSTEAVAHLARWRGASVGCAAAEAFVVGRHRA